MKIITLDKYSSATILLMIISAFFITLSLISNLNEFINSTFVISGALCAMFGIFILTFSGSEPVNPRLVGIHSAQDSITICRLMHHFGFHGNSYFLPPRIVGGANVMQFNPISIYDGKTKSEKESFQETGPAGLVITPSCYLLIQDLHKRNSLVLPYYSEENFTLLLQEIIVDLLELSSQISTSWHYKTVTITFHDYRFIDKCQMISQASADCCNHRPCPVCSLCGVLIAAGNDRVVKLERCSGSSSLKDVTAVFSILPLPDSYP